MENNDSNLKPQPTGGLKLMTVFIAVLALHVMVIGGFTVYHLMSGGSTDTDLLTDKLHKNVKAEPDGIVTTDSPLPDASQADKNPTAPAAPTDVASIPANPQTPPPDQAAPTVTDTPAPTPASTPATAATPTANLTTPTEASIPSASELVTTPVEIAPVPPPSAPVASGPVTMPTVEPTPAPEPVVAVTYVVKIHDSLIRIAHLNHTSVAKLKEANGLKTDLLRIGQKLALPGGTQVAATTGPAASPDASPTTTVLSDSPTGPILGASTPAKAKPAAGIVSTSSPTGIAPAELHHHLYTVVKGDTLIRIAHKFKTTPTAIMTANNITDPAKLSIGKKLKIPSREARSAKISEPVPTPAQPSQVKENASSAQLANFVP